MDNLTPKQKAFCEYYLVSLNATEAAEKAGYSKKSCKTIGFQNINKPAIKDYIEKRLNKADNNRIASANEVLEYLTRVVRGEEKEREAVYNPDAGQVEVVDVEPDIRERTKAAELLGKRYAIFTDKQQVDVTVDKGLEDFFGDA